MLIVPRLHALLQVLVVLEDLSSQVWCKEFGGAAGNVRKWSVVGRNYFTSKQLCPAMHLFQSNLSAVPCVS